MDKGKNKIRVLHIPAGGLGHGGVSFVIFSIVQALYKDFDFSSVVFTKRCNRENDFLNYGKLYRISGYKGTIIDKFLRPITMIYSIWNICRKEKFNVIHCHNDFEQAFCLLGAKLAGVPMRIAHSHVSKSPERLSFLKKIYQSICRILIKYCSTHKIGCSELASKHFFENNYQVITNSIDLKRFTWEIHKNCNQWSFVHVGRYSSSKNQKFVLEIYAKLRLLYPNSTLDLVGFGQDVELLKKEVGKLGLNSFVRLYSATSSEIPNIFRKSDVMIFPSIYEGFGIVLLEAQASGCMCFASEAVPNDANVGLMQRISLTEKSDVWVDLIDSYLRKGIYDVNYDLISRNLHKFSTEYVTNKYLTLYESAKAF